MATYKGSSKDGNRARMLESRREQESREFRHRLESLKDADPEVRTLSDSFASGDGVVGDAALPEPSIALSGLMTVEEYERRSRMARFGDLMDPEKERKRRRLEKFGVGSKMTSKSSLDKRVLSFEIEEEEEMEEEVDERQGKFGVRKDPSVDTSFLPDKQREEAEKRERERLAEEWEKEQERIKKEVVEITYSYYDGTGNRRFIRCPKGWTIAQFLEACRRDLADQFPELKGCAVENLMYVKEDLIIPLTYSFYDLIVTKARGKSGPLFRFDAVEDIRINHDFRSLERDESHAGKIVTRFWYERNKHTFPASRWEIYDPSIERGKYSFKS